MSSSTLFSKETFVHAISGALGSVTAMSLILPLDTVRSRLLLDDSKHGNSDSRSQCNKLKNIPEQRLAGKMNKTNEELIATYEKLLPEQNKDERHENTLGTNELSNAQQLPPDSAFQVLLNLLREEGISSLFRGAQSTLICVAVSNFVYFYAFNALKRWSLIGVDLNQNGQKSSNAIRDLFFACSAGVANVLITNPLWVVNSRIKMQGVKIVHNGSVNNSECSQRKYKGLIDGLIQMAYHEGVPSVWAGTIPSLVLVSQPTIKFTIYEFLKRHYLQLYANKLALMELDKSLSGTKTFFIGALANAIATLITYPIQVVQAKMRHGGSANRRADVNGELFSKNGKQDTTGMIKTTIYLVRSFGLGYLYRGLDAKLLQSFITAGFMFLAYEKISRLLLLLLLPQKKKILTSKIS